LAELARAREREKEDSESKGFVARLKQEYEALSAQLDRDREIALVALLADRRAVPLRDIYHRGANLVVLVGRDDPATVVFCHQSALQLIADIRQKTDDRPKERMGFRTDPNEALKI